MSERAIVTVPQAHRCTAGRHSVTLHDGMVHQ